MFACLLNFGEMRRVYFNYIKRRDGGESVALSQSKESSQQLESGVVPTSVVYASP